MTKPSDHTCSANQPSAVLRARQPCPGAAPEAQALAFRPVRAAQGAVQAGGKALGAGMERLLMFDALGCP